METISLLLEVEYLKLIFLCKFSSLIARPVGLIVEVLLIISHYCTYNFLQRRDLVFLNSALDARYVQYFQIRSPFVIFMAI